MFVRPDVRVSGGLRPLRGHTAPQRPQPGRHARCETDKFGLWTRYCKRRGKGGLKRRIMGRFFFAGCTRAGGRRDGRRRQAEDGRSQMGADGRAPLPSVRAFAYKMKPKRLGKRSVLSSAQITQKSGRKTSRQILAEHEGQSQNRSRRDIRRTNLVSELFEFVDSGKIKLCPAAELSYP